MASVANTVNPMRLCPVNALHSRCMRIPVITSTHYDASRPPVTIDRDQCEGAVGVHLLISEFGHGVKRGEGRPRSQQEGPARAAECPNG